MCTEGLKEDLSIPFISPLLSHRNYKSVSDDLHHCLTIGKPKLLFISRGQVVTFDGTADTEDLAFNDLLKETVDYTQFEVVDEDVEETLILYSSGTTGLPKGVVLTPDSVKATLKCMGGSNIANIKDSCVLGLLPIYHIFGFIVSTSCLLFGKKNVSLDKFKPEIFLEAIQQHRISKLFLVPPLVLFLAKSPLVDNYDLSSVKDIVSGAAPLGDEIQNMVSKRLGVEVRQAYGLTETGVVTCTPPGVQKCGTVGKVVEDVELKIVDTSSGRILGNNLVGEICCKGPGFMKEYKNDWEATKECTDEDGFLHVGDIGYVDDEGYLYIVGRIKEIIKYKGFQVPPAQLEAILAKHPDVKDVGVVGRPDERAGELPTALVVRQPATEITERRLIDYIAERVSVEKQLHGGVVFVNEIPKTSSGKILRRELIKLV
ncbi:hypothetical protein NQ318_001040 [Aromia moschata]|uniref:Luciferin 4-monooxygenase n=1 Tax=Aromia moschata TaxID=1265417 RepID=A0AAV8ZGF3_9CUCU|nr:hypothetical protein NQ318_001040 [Aromia moschata]